MSLTFLAAGRLFCRFAKSLLIGEFQNDQSEFGGWQSNDAQLERSGGGFAGEVQVESWWGHVRPLTDFSPYLFPRYSSLLDTIPLLHLLDLAHWPPSYCLKRPFCQFRVGRASDTTQLISRPVSKATCRAIYQILVYALHRTRIEKSTAVMSPSASNAFNIQPVSRFGGSNTTIRRPRVRGRVCSLRSQLKS